MRKTELTVAQVATIAGCHRNTVLNYEQRGFIRPLRDHNNFRRFPQSEALKLRELLNFRASNDKEHPGNQG